MPTREMVNPSGQLDTLEALRHSSLPATAAGSQHAGHRGDEAHVDPFRITVEKKSTSTDVDLEVARLSVSMLGAGLTATDERNEDMLFLFEVFDISLSVPQVKRLEEFKVTNISDLCNLSPANASLLVSTHNFPQHFLSVLWFLDHKRDWMPKDMLSIFLADWRTEVSFV